MQLVMFSHVDVAGIGGEEAVTRVGAPVAIGLPTAHERPRSGGRVSLASADPAVPALIGLNFADDPEDLRGLRRVFASRSRSRTSWRSQPTWSGSRR